MIKLLSSWEEDWFLISEIVHVLIRGLVSHFRDCSCTYQRTGFSFPRLFMYLSEDWFLISEIVNIMYLSARSEDSKYFSATLIFEFSIDASPTFCVLV